MESINGNGEKVCIVDMKQPHAMMGLWGKRDGPQGDSCESRKMCGIVRVSREGVECPTLMRCPFCDSGGREGGDGLQQNQRRFGFMIIRNSSMQKQNVSAKRLCFSGGPLYSLGFSC